MSEAVEVQKQHFVGKIVRGLGREGKDELMGSQVTPAHHRAAMCGTDQGLGMGHISGTPMQALDPWKCRGAAPSCGAGRGAQGAWPS